MERGMCKEREHVTDTEKCGSDDEIRTEDLCHDMYKREGHWENEPSPQRSGITNRC